MLEVRRSKPQIVRSLYGRGCLSETTLRKGEAGGQEKLGL